VTLDGAELWIGRAGAAAAAVAILVVFAGLAWAERRPRGRATGMGSRGLRWPVYVLTGIPCFALWSCLWRPIPLALSPPVRTALLVAGTLLYFPGLALVLWARMTLGEMYNVSSSAGVQLHADHRLVTDGAFALVRQPMYLGIPAAALGGLFIYRTWTLMFTLGSAGLVLRARREEQALAAEFGEEWNEYCRRVPAWLPRSVRRGR
jgi:protein-S-isoprenylcysteine O-methyltransferase Ste14